MRLPAVNSLALRQESQAKIRQEMPITLDTTLAMDLSNSVWLYQSLD